ncbi:MAG: ABC transporter ATP-binding protein [Kiloniellales bacterium]|nr:ABC transporter ATP-binding protein [Kiloniellales bacterium]
MIALDQVSKSYRTAHGRHSVLDNVTCEFPLGKSVGILGLNGAGKSTLLRLIGGVEPPDCGTIRRDASVSWPLGLSGAFPGTLTGRENARFVSRLYGAAPGQVEAFAEDFAELGRYYDEPVRTYSSGMRARLGFAVSIAVDFDFYLVDEATSVGDWRFTAKCFRMFRERRAESSFILVSHNEETVRRTCDLGAVLSNGRLTMYEDMNAAIAAYRHGLH